MKNNGFTLIELLAVMVLLSIVGIITIPVITVNIERSRVSAYRTNTQTLIEAAKQYVSKNMSDNDFPENGVNIKNIKINKSTFKSGLIKRCNNKDVKDGNCTKEQIGEVIAINVYDGKYCSKGVKQNIEVIKVKNVKECNSLDTTAPDLDLKIVKRTNNSILVAAYGYDAQSKIKKYTFKIGNGIPVSKTTNSKVATYEFTGLKSNQEYEITVSIENEHTGNKNVNTYKTTKSIIAKTLNVGIPTFAVTGSSYSGGKEVAITYPNIDGGVNYYSVTYDNGKTWTTTKVNNNRTTIKFVKNGKVKAYTKYNGGQVENTLNLVGIDNEGPVIKRIINSTNWETSKEIMVEAVDTGVGLAEKPYSFDGGKTWVSKNTKSFKSNQNINFIVRDRIGNKTKKTIVINRIDTVSPTCELKVTSGTLGLNNWYRSNINIGFSKTNDQAISTDGKTKITGSGIKKQTISQSTITKDGTYNVVGTVEDGAGNKGTCKLSVKKDSTLPTKPSISLYVSSTTGNLSTGGGYGSGSWTNRNVMTRAYSSDSGSGISYYQYSHDGRNWSNDISKLGWAMSYGNNKSRIDYWINWEGQWNFYVRAVDNAGNLGPASNMFTIRIDKTAPSCNWSGESTSWTNWSRTINVTGTDNGGSGINQWYRSYSWPFTSGTVQIRYLAYTIKDNAGNETTCAKAANVYVDKEPPTIQKYCTTRCFGSAGTQCMMLSYSDSGSGGIVRGDITWTEAAKTLSAPRALSNADQLEAHTGDFVALGSITVTDAAGNSRTEYNLRCP